MFQSGLNALHVAMYYFNDDAFVLETLMKNGCVANAKSAVSRFWILALIKINY